MVRDIFSLCFTSLISGHYVLIVNVLFRDAWKQFFGFPHNNAILAYLYIVQQLLTASESSDGKGSGSGDVGNHGFGAIVSTLK